MAGRSPRVATKDDIVKFLKELKTLVSVGNFRIDPRNYESMGKMGIDIDGASLTLLGLTMLDYSAGPMNDRDEWREGDVWLFGARFSEYLIYIKIRLDGDNALCISFHEAQNEMRFPFK